MSDGRMVISRPVECGDMACKYCAVEFLSGKAQQECEGPIQLGCVGGILTKS